GRFSVRPARLLPSATDSLQRHDRRVVSPHCRRWSCDGGMEVPALATARMKTWLWLYPRSWRKRYGREMEVLLDDLPREAGVGLDLVLGAGTAYAAVIRGNRILASAGAFLHGVCVAVLLQAIAFVTFILFGLSSNLAADAWFGPFHIDSIERSWLLFNGLEPLMWVH